MTTVLSSLFISNKTNITNNVTIQSQLLSNNLNLQSNLTCSSNIAITNNINLNNLNIYIFHKILLNSMSGTKSSLLKSKLSLLIELAETVLLVSFKLIFGLIALNFLFVAVVLKHLHYK